MELDVSTALSLHDIRYNTTPNSNGTYNMVRWDTDENITVNDSALEIIKLFAKGKSIGETARILHTPLDEVFNLTQFLIRSAYVRSVGSHKIEDSSTPIHPWLHKVPLHWFSSLVSKPLMIFTFLYMVSGILLGVLITKHIPSYIDFFWTEDLFFISIVGAVVGWGLVLTHESAHFFVAKAVGAESTLRFSSRFFDLVMITDHFHLAVLDKPFRYMVYLSGMYIDMLLAATIYWVFIASWAFSVNLGILGPFLNSIFLSLVVGVVWEFNMYLETDTYNFFSDSLDQDNLYNNTKKYLYNRVRQWRNPLLILLRDLLIRFMFSRKRLSETDDMRLFSPNERKIIHFFSIYYIIGLVVSTILFFTITLPRDIKFIGGSFGLLIVSISLGDAIGFVESLIIIILAIFPNALLINAIINKH